MEAAECFTCSQLPRTVKQTAEESVTERGWRGLQKTFLEEAEGLPCIWPLLCPQWNLVCSHRAFRQLAQSLYMVGVLLGAMMFGYLADRSVLGKPRSWVKLGLGSPDWIQGRGG